MSTSTLLTVIKVSDSTKIKPFDFFSLYQFLCKIPVTISYNSHLQFCNHDDLRGDVIKRPFAVPTAHAHRRSIWRWEWAAGWALARLSALPSAHAHRPTIRNNKKLVSVTCCDLMWLLFHTLEWWEYLRSSNISCTIANCLPCFWQHFHIVKTIPQIRDV